METGFDARTQRLGDPVVCTQLYYCGGTDEKQIERIMKQGFSKEGIMWSIVYLLCILPVLSYYLIYLLTHPSVLL